MILKSTRCRSPLSPENVILWLWGSLTKTVSILASFCVSLKCKDVVNRDSTFRVMSVVSTCKSEEFQVPCQPSGRSSHPVRTPICPLFHPSGRRVIPSKCQTDQHHPSGQSVQSVRTPYCIEKFLCQLASVQTF